MGMICSWVQLIVSVNYPENGSCIKYTKKYFRKMKNTIFSRSFV
jgi:hypothetical protein